uniref:Uncharacterized protein n=1 Tax=Cacopsylla melanoneura TaxID=428564 RepID=A0A8D8TKY9_9HEMI
MQRGVAVAECVATLVVQSVPVNGKCQPGWELALGGTRTFPQCHGPRPLHGAEQSITRRVPRLCHAELNPLRGLGTVSMVAGVNLLVHETSEPVLIRGGMAVVHLTH